MEIISAVEKYSSREVMERKLKNIQEGETKSGKFPH